MQFTKSFTIQAEQQQILDRTSRLNPSPVENACLYLLTPECEYKHIISIFIFKTKMLNLTMLSKDKISYNCSPLRIILFPMNNKLSLKYFKMNNLRIK